MKLRTKNKIVNAGKDVFSRFDSKVTLEITGHNEVSRNGNHIIEIEHRYLDELENDITPTGNVYKMDSSEKINAFAESINALIPEGLSHTELSDFKVLIGAKSIMAKTLNIPFSEIEIIEDEVEDEIVEPDAE